MASSFAFINDKKKSSPGSPSSSSFNFTESPSRKEFKSAFSFNDSDHESSSSTSSFNKKNRPKFNFSSSFIMEELVGDEVSTQKAPRKKKSSKITKSYFSFIDDLAEEHDLQHKSVMHNGSRFQQEKRSPDITRQYSSSSIQQSSVSRSAFDFMNRQDNTFADNPLLIYDDALSEEERSPSIASSSVFSSNKIKQDNEVKYLHVQSTWDNLQQKKATHLTWVESLYQKQALVMDKLHSIQDELACAQEEQAQAVASENFQIAQQYTYKIETLEKNRDYLKYEQLNELIKEVRTGWQRMVDLLEKEATLAESIIQYGQLVKEERQQKLKKFVSDIELIRNTKIQDIEKKRQGLESAKSEIAFDYDMWNQNDTELNERKEEAIHVETKQKKELFEKSEKIKNEISELKAKLKVLEAEDATLDKAISEVDLVITEKLKPFIKEEEELQQEKELIHKRQTEIEEETVILDREDEDIQIDIRKQDDKKKQDEQELKELDEQIQTAIKREKLNQDEIQALQNALQKLTEERDLVISRHQEQIKAAQDKIKLKLNEIKTMSINVYRQENLFINLEDFITNITSKLTRLKKLKQLAVQNHEFENATQLTQEIKATELSLEEANIKKEAHTDLDTLKAQVAQEKSSLSAHQQEFKEMEKQKAIEVENLLKNMKHELSLLLSNHAHYDAFRTLVGLELSSPLNNSP